MIRDEVEQFLGKRVRLVSDFGNNNPVFYTGTIKTISNDSIVFIDKFEKLVAIALDSIKKVEEVSE